MERVTYIDIAKGIAILSVVLLHVAFVWPFGETFRIDGLLGWAWHVPVFFVIAGFFINEEKLSKPRIFTLGKIKSLYRLALYIYLPATLGHNLLFKIGWYSNTEVYGGKVIDLWNFTEYVKGIALTLLCAGREPIVGAMWFVYSLLFALCGYSIVTYIVKKCYGGYEQARFVLLLVLQIVSCVVTNQLNITIPRFSNAISAMFLICLGQLINQKLKPKYDNVWIFLTSLLIIIQSVALTGVVGLNNNDYRDVLQLDVVALAALYCICFIAKKIERNYVGKLLRRCGNDSFYIMGLHIVGFHVFTMALVWVGLFPAEQLQKLMTPTTGNFLLLLLYTIFGIGVPLLIMYVIRKIKDIINKLDLSKLKA